MRRSYRTRVALRNRSWHVLVDFAQRTWRIGVWNQVTGEEQPPEIIVRRRARWPRWLAGAVILFAVVLLVLWSQRKPLADNFIARELARRGVQGRYTVTQIGFSTQRIENVVIGDPRDPDLRADWVEVQTRVGFTGASVTGFRVGHGWLRARLKDGVLSFGQVDKLLPPPSGKPITLPKLDAEIDEGRVRLEMPQGLVLATVAGKGRLDDGFAGSVGVTSDRLDFAGCRVTGTRAAMQVRIADARPNLHGRVGADLVRCGETLAQGAAGLVDVRLAETLDRWQGSAEQAGAQVVKFTAGSGVKRLSGKASFAGNAERTTGTLDFATGDFDVHEPGAVWIDGHQGRLQGRYELGATRSGFEGAIAARGVALDTKTVAQVRKLGDSAAGTPAGPLAAQFAAALARAGQGFDATAAVSARLADGKGTVSVEQAAFDGAGGVHGVWRGAGLRYGWPQGKAQVNGELTLAGGGLPDERLVLTQTMPGGPVRGVLTVQPYAVGGARIALEPVRFAVAPNGKAQFATRAELSGPLGDGGRIERLSLPLEGRWDGRALVLNPQCGMLGFDRLAVASLVLDRSRLALCPVGGGWVTMGPKGLGGGARGRGLRLGGRLGESRLQLNAAAIEVMLGARGFRLDKAATALGDPGAQTRLDFAQLEGKASGAGLGGSFTGGSGQIRNIALLMSDAVGKWNYANGVLRVENGLSVTDGMPDPRFKPLRSDDVVLTLADNRMRVTGTLHTPGQGIKVADVVIGHDLSSGAGQADLDVPGIFFADGGFQPNDLTPLTFGVIAGVTGKVSGHGAIRWASDGNVTSTGVFRTDKLDLAAAFGPVTGLGTEVHFSDLLNMTTEPGQVANVGTLNPGIPVENGVIRYRLLGGQKIEVESGRWPFAGGELLLEPAVLDFSSTQEKKLVFRVKGADAAQFLQQMQFENLNATGIFDGVLPILFDAKGGRIEGGSLTARAGGGTLAYVGAVSQEDLGFWGNMAFQALKSLRYRELALQMDGPLTGEMITQIRFAGVQQGEGTHTNFLIKRLIHLPFVFNVTIRAPFRQLVDSVQSYYDPSRLVERNLPALIEQQSKETGEVIQPPESETVP